MRTRTGVFLMAVLLGATACGTRAAPPTARAAGSGAPLPWLAGGLLHHGDLTVPLAPTGADRMVASAGTTLVGRTDARRSRWWLLDHDRLVPLLDERAAYVEPVLSADGGTVAWRVRRVLTAYDVPTRSVLGRVRTSGTLTVAAVADDGRVAVTDGGDRVLVWRAGDDPVPATWRDFGGRPSDGAVRSPDETLSAGPDPVVRDVRTGERTVLDLPADPRWRVLMWADDSHVLLARPRDGGPPEVLGCDVPSGTCTPVLNGPPAGAVLPGSVRWHEAEGR